MSGFDVYRTYLALKTHFNNDSYDFFKNNGQVSAKQDTFHLRPDRWSFEKVYSKYPKTYFEFLLSNISQDRHFYIKQFNSQKSKDTYLEWMRKKESRFYILEQTITLLKDVSSEKNIKIHQAFKPLKNTHPVFFQLYLAKKIDLETFIIFFRSLSLGHLWKEYESDIIYQNTMSIIKKYKLFVEYIPKYKEYIINECTR